MIEFFLVFFNIICYIIDIISYIFVTEDNTMDIKTLQYFIAVVESTSITKAARVLHISQPPLSQQIKQLEAELETQLLERGPRCVTLTDAGETLYHRAKSIVSFTEDTRREIRSIGSGNSGHIRVGLISSFDPGLLSDILSAFFTEYPGVRFDIYEKNTYELIDSLENNLIELAFVRSPFSSDTYEMMPLTEDPISAVGSSDLFEGASEKALDISFFHNKPVIVYRRWKHILDECFRKQGVEPVYYCVNDDAKTSLLLASAGNAIALVPASISGIIPDSDDMMTIPIDTPELVTETFVIWRSDRYLSPAAVNFIESIEQFAAYSNRG